MCTIPFLISHSLSEVDNSFQQRASDITEGLYRNKKLVLSHVILKEPILKFLAFSENVLHLIPQTFPEMDNSVKVHVLSFNMILISSP